jgi:hypothetical protein
MTVSELKDELRVRSLSMQGVKADLLQRLEDSVGGGVGGGGGGGGGGASSFDALMSVTTLDNSNTVTEIKAELKVRGLKVSGVKEQLLERLHDFDINGGGDVAMKQKATGGKRKRKSTAKSGGDRKRMKK